MAKLNVLIAGSTGYIGIQLIKILIKHKKVNIKFLCGNNSVGRDISLLDNSLRKYKLPKIVKFQKKFLNDVDVVFTALPNGQAQKISLDLLKKNILIDLAADFRLIKSSEYFKWYKLKHKAPKNIKRSIYALPELIGKKIKRYNIIGCPGCYPTSILIPLIPLIKKKTISNKDIIIDSKSGYSGAGRSVHKKYKDKNLYDSIRAYGVGFHRHSAEIDQELNIIGEKKVSYTFTPHLSPMFRGILSTIYFDLKKNVSINRIQNILKKYYKKNKFIKILPLNTIIGTREVMNTNNCYISLCKTRYKNKVILLSAIDNLIKGGAGQAVQNMNLKFGINEYEGLK